jgi:hypothetical protein
MATPDDFAAACRSASRGLRQVPSDLRRELSTVTKDQVAVPLAGRIAKAATGPHAAILAAGTKARAGADPTIVVGGMRPKLSGGAGPRDVVFGDEFGGGKRLGAVPRGKRSRAHRRHTTNQFRGAAKPFVFPTIGANIPWVLDTFADVTLSTLTKGVNRG